MLVWETHPFSPKKSRLDQLSCFLFGVRYCTTPSINYIMYYTRIVLVSCTSSYKLEYIVPRKTTTPEYIMTNNYVMYLPARTSVFCHTECTAKYCVLRAVRNTPMSQCSVWCFARVLVVAGWGCGLMTRHHFQKRKRKLPPRKSFGKGLIECPRKP